MYQDEDVDEEPPAKRKKKASGGKKGSGAKGKGSSQDVIDGATVAEWQKRIKGGDLDGATVKSLRAVYKAIVGKGGSNLSKKAVIDKLEALV